MRGTRGFTLVELLIVLAIVAVLTAIVVPNLLASKMAANEASAIAALRTIGSAQAQVQGSGRIDVDRDSVGEYGTLVELDGETGVRAGSVPGPGGPGSDFSVQGSPLDPPALSPATADYLQDSGHMLKSGYAILVFLPDSGATAGWVHEAVVSTTVGRGRRRRTVSAVKLLNPRGGPPGAGTDLAESLWCAYAQPVARGSTGDRVFFTSQQGDLLHSSNGTAKHEGESVVIDPGSAFLGAGFTSGPAVGTRGGDGDVWKVTN